MKKAIRFFTLIPISILAACATQQPLPKAIFADAKRVGVVSYIGDTLNKQYIGFTVFNNERDTQNVSEWNLDTEYEKQLANAVRIVFGAEAIPLSESRSKYFEVNSLNGPYSAPAFWGPNFEKVSDVAKHSCQIYRLDAILIAAKWKSEDILGRTNQSIEGVGIYGRRGNAVIHVFAKVGYFDCKSGKTINVARVLKALISDTVSSKPGLVTASIDSELASKPYAQWTSSEKQSVAKTIENLPDTAWISTLRGLVPAP